ncbi:MAG TPA: hypothetical protein IAC63_01530 [Candidatus Enterousia avicola]|uniref:Uncharacterized protein n=1 Tax=Candidatus Enterousia avicola TaxID=2840787 RepID=A0A9D1SMR3_9PROT|nr:hypothetical protein [Candidatus Enterousia avicola]
MRNILLFIIAIFIDIADVEAAVRSADTINRQQQTLNDTGSTVVARTTIARNNTTSIPLSQQVTNRTPTASSRDGTGNTVNRSATVTNASARNTAQTSSTARTASNTIARSTTGVSTATQRGTTSSGTVSRSATTTKRTGTVTSPARTARATTIAATTTTNTFGTGYNTCRNAYFTCMDQFCATANDSYRRCVCSSRLTDVQERERALSQTSDQLQDFKNLNIEVIPKTAEEVNAMLSASEGELAITTDSSASAQQLEGIREVLASSKNQALSTLGTLDIAGDINQIWATTDLASGQNIANLTGEALYNAVHSQCVDLVAEQCPSSSTLSMVVSAYGMYIENDCSTLLNSLDSKLVQANSTIRDTEREMNVARLENYNAHNSTAINDCIAQVRKDITADTACGTDYVHCLDITGLYLNRDTGEPIYSANFYQLSNQISLDGDVLTNATNRLIVAELNNKKIYAERGLETCQDIADEVWDEFVRQAIVEIYQGQQEKIRDVKNECLDVVNACYDEQSESLKDFSNVKEELLLGSRLELSEELCQEKLYACSNLYGDPNGNGLELLLSAMHDLTDQKIAAECRSLLEAFAKDTCNVASNDSLHSYPYACRVYAPGDAIYASNYYCNQLQWNPSSDSSDGTIVAPTGYSCPSVKKYKSCEVGYYMATKNYYNEWKYNGTPVAQNACIKCPEGATCPGGTQPPQGLEEDNSKDCGEDYAGSLYQKMVKYATQVCVRPSDYDAIVTGEKSIPTTVLEDVNIVMDSIRVDMAKSLSAECERLGGTWVDTQWVTTSPDGEQNKVGHELFKYFYDETGSNTKWGYCADSESVSTATLGL